MNKTAMTVFGSVLIALLGACGALGSVAQEKVDNENAFQRTTSAQIEHQRQQLSDLRRSAAPRHELDAAQERLDNFQRIMEASQKREATVIADDKGKTVGQGLGLINSLLVLLGGGGAAGATLSGLLQKFTPSRGAAELEKVKERGRQVESKLDLALATITAFQEGLTQPAPPGYTGPGDTVPPSSPPAPTA